MNFTKVDLLSSGVKGDARYEKRSALRRMKLFATLLLCLMFVIYIISSLLEKNLPIFALFKAFSEAGMVGALADWFAIVALFRYPFGVPIPHTAIIPKNKNSIGKALADFIETNFLNENAIKEKIESSDPTKHVADWLSISSNRKSILNNVKSFIPDIFGVLQNEEIKLFLSKNLKDNLKNLNFAKLLQNILESLTKDNQHDKWIESIISEIKKLINKNKYYIRKKVEDQTPWWTFGILDNKIFESIMTNINDFINEFETNKDNKFRKEIDDRIAKLITGLGSDEKLISKVETFKNNIIENNELSGYISSFTADVVKKLNDDINSDNSEILKLADISLAKFADNLKNNNSVQNQLNNFVHDLAVSAVSSNSNKICSIITDTIEKWNEEEISRELELQVGKDLQYIRINGTLVGGLVGVGIYIISLIIN